jgi:hypothetical protein
MRRPKDEIDGREVAELAALADGSLAPEDRAALEARVAASPALAERLAEQQRAVALSQRAGDTVEAPQALRARIEAQQRSRGARTPGRFALIASAATAAAVLAVGIGLASRGSGTVGPRFQAALGSTSLASDASGRATLTKTSSGWRVRLDAHGLPRLAGGRFYEAWLRNAGGVLVPIGTFNEGRNVTLWAGVSPETFTTLSVTREQADGDQGSSGEKVLVGRIVGG